VAVLGCTGSIGRQALEVIACSEGLSVRSLLCAGSVEEMLAQAADCGAEVLGATCAETAPAGVVCGDEALEACLDGADLVLNGIVGSAGLRASLACARLGLPLALANKESLVVGGHLLSGHVEAGMVVPVDSEHSTVFRCLEGERRPPRSITLTASGGALRDMPPERVPDASVEEVLAHPNWDMGARITVDSATMVNKAFEVIEAGWLFGRGVRVDAVVHPQSIVHSLVRLADGAWKALLGTPDMRVPIQYALQYPDGGLLALEDDVPGDWPRLEFRPMDGSRWPAFGLVVEASRAGESHCVAANAADEVAVRAFLEGRIPFGGIPRVMEAVLRRHTESRIPDMQAMEAADAEARRLAREEVGRL
jgi:1-deoxy-D-xylulose-5-phosphate reductoisomerase